VVLTPCLAPLCVLTPCPPLPSGAGELATEDTIDSAWAPPPMNDCTLVISWDACVTTGGGCRSSGAKGSLRYTLRGGRASAGSQSTPTPLSPPVPSSTMTITEGR